MKQGKFRAVKVAFVAVSLVSFMTSSIASSVSAKPSGVVRSLPAAKTTTSTSVIRKSKVTKTQIVETSIKTAILTVTTVEKNSATSNTTSNKGTRVLTNTSSMKTSATTTVKTVKSLTKTTVTTTVVTTRVETFMKAPMGKLKFTFAVTYAGMSAVLIMESLERLKFKYGYEGKYTEVGPTDLVIAGAASGQFEMGSSGVPGIQKIMQGGAPLRFFGENMRNSWMLIGKSSIKSCADMEGKRVAQGTRGTAPYGLFYAWIKKNCLPTFKFNEMFVGNSTLRRVALLADRVDMALLEIEDALGLPKTDYGIVADFNKDLPKVKIGLLWAQQSFLDGNPNVAADLVYEVSRLSQEVNQDPVVFKAIILKWRPEYAANVDRIVEVFRETKLFPEDPGTFFQDLNETNAFFAALGVLQPGMLAEQMATLTPLKQARKRLDF